MDSMRINQFKITLKKIGINKYEVKKSFNALNNKVDRKNAKVVVHHSIPLPISIKDMDENLIGKGLLLIHLYQTPCSPCILCAICKKFFSVQEFFSHSEEILKRQSDKFDKEKLKIEPCFFNNQTRFTSNQMKIWKEFNSKNELFKKN
ncbi:hypothetical protein BpHYR1_039963 [Brachionus plicatilis]|uniref:c-SKI SMAD4-binding domain-containing protein n=1 Tax=Brachionus plicatilis TaxID=10195 RepID=A0A3M7RKB0_BRAPC|nr:hypothetical protein BpHYR1_039963 [Brachionus plicatilis]